MGNYGIVRLDLMGGHVYGADIDVAIENGLLGEVNEATGKLVATTDITKKQVLVASQVATNYDSNDESDFRNEPNTYKVRYYELIKGDFFATTQLDFSGNRANIGAVAIGDYAYAKVGGKFTVASALPVAPADVPTQVFRVHGIVTLNGKNALVLKVEVA